MIYNYINTIIIEHITIILCSENNFFLTNWIIHTFYKQDLGLQNNWNLKNMIFLHKLYSYNKNISDHLYKKLLYY